MQQAARRVKQSNDTDASLCGKRGPPDCSFGAHLCDLSAFVVSPQQRHVRGIPRFAQHQQREDLQAVVASVYKVSHEDVVGAWRLPAGVEQLQQVVKLTVYVAAYLRS